LNLADLAPLGVCTLTLTATATDGNDGFVAGLPTEDGVAYPYINVSTALTSACQHNALNDGGGVNTAYHGNVDGLPAPVPVCDQFDGTSASDVCADGTTGCGTAEFALIPAGTFTMGAPDNDGGPGIGGPSWGENQHDVTLTRAFWMSETEVTQAQWLAVFPGSNPSGFSPTNAYAEDLCRPVEQVSWFMAAAYMNALSAAQMPTLTACYDLSLCNGSAAAADIFCTDVPSISDCTGYRLPTEAEWEYAARAGTETATYNGNLTESDCTNTTLLPIAWFCGNALSETHAVQGKDANDWGLYDMLGNVWEWVGDRYGSYGLIGVLTDPTGPNTGDYRVFRGGSWDNSAFYVRAAMRDYVPPDFRYFALGFRPARSVFP